MSQRQLWVVRQFCLVVFTIACFSGIAGAQLADTRMGLVAPGIGWVVQNQGTPVVRNDHLSWTSDDGGTWKDITPRDVASKEIASVFFLDTSRGWTLFALKGKESTGASHILGFDLAITVDGGAAWTHQRVTVPPASSGWNGSGRLFFLDSKHGWLNLELALHDWAVGSLFATDDGGVTWKQVQGFNVDAGYGSIRFKDLKNGWVAGGPYGQQHLYATHDGGLNWQYVSLPAISGISAAPDSSASQFGTPMFSDEKHGFLSATYTGTDNSGNDFKALALFSTDDTGRSWRCESWVNLGEDRGVLAFAVTDLQAITPKLSTHSAVSLVKVGVGGKVTEIESAGVPSSFAPSSLEFANAANGWALLSDGRLLSTSDGGITWHEITQGGKKTSVLTPQKSGTLIGSPATGLQSSDTVSPSVPVAAASTVTTYKSRHMGFDACALPTTGQMSTWWNSGPYFDYGVYVGGVNTHCATLTSSWVKTVTAQGWGLIPIWVGPQAPCTCAPNGGTWPNCTRTWTTIGTSGVAYAQGQSEADAATASRGIMSKLGLGTGAPVYIDIENYSPSATCSGSPTGSYVNSFLSGWVSEVQKNGYVAGVYGNPGPATDWSGGGTGYGAVSPSPNDVWIAKYDNRVTIWGLTGLADAPWPTDQRGHQYVANQTVKWGGLQLPIDADVEDADVVGGNGAKTYSFSYTLIDEYGVGRTTPIGINNSGQIVGQYADTTTTHGFVDSSGVLTSIDFPFATGTYAYGINNNGEVVGFYTDQQFHEHGFLYQAGSYISFDPPGAIQTRVFGINDDDQISGYYADSLGVHHGFQYQGGTFTSISYPSASGTETYGINGDAQIAGGCPNLDCPPFLYAQGVFSYPPVGPDALNNNEQINGFNGGPPVFEHEGISITIAPPGASMTNPLYSPNDFLLNSQTTAKVALVGSCVINGVFHGFLATSQ